MTVAADFTWDLDYDASWFIPLPGASDLARDPATPERWVRACLEHFADQAIFGPDQLPAIRATAEALVAQARPSQAQLWFAPRGIYSDLLVSISVARSEDAGTTEELFDGASLSTAADATPLRTETHGAGYLFRRNGVADGEGSTLVEQWTVRLNNGSWAILVDTIGTALPAFVLFEQQLIRLISGIILPPPAPSTSVRG